MRPRHWIGWRCAFVPDVRLQKRHCCWLRAGRDWLSNRPIPYSTATVLYPSRICCRFQRNRLDLETEDCGKCGRLTRPGRLCIRSETQEMLESGLSETKRLTPSPSPSPQASPDDEPAQKKLHKMKSLSGSRSVEKYAASAATTPGSAGPTICTYNPTPGSWGLVHVHATWPS